VVGTDGIWEARNGAGQMFGKGRLREVIRANARSSARAVLEAVIEAVGAFRAGQAQEDDITLVVVRREA